MSKEVVLCVSNAYQKKYYLNENFNGLPQTIRDELKIMCVLYTEDVGGILELVFDEDGNLDFRTSCKENDFFYDEIYEKIAKPIFNYVSENGNIPRMNKNFSSAIRETEIDFDKIANSSSLLHFCAEVGKPYDV